MGLVIGTLVFWKQKPGKAKDARRLDAALREGKVPKELEPLPEREIVRALKKQYPGMEWGKGFAEVDLDDVEAGIELAWKPSHFRFDFYGNGFAQMDVVAQLMAGFGCWCYFQGEKAAYPPGALPTFHDAEEDERLEAEIEAAARHAKKVGGDRLAQLRAAVEFMQAGGLRGESETKAGRGAAKRSGRRKK